MPDIYRMYEDLCGSLNPWVAEELADAEKEYPPEWIEAAFKEAALQNVRRWRYVARILERFNAEGVRPMANGAAYPSFFEERYRRVKEATP